MAAKLKIGLLAAALTLGSLTIPTFGQANPGGGNPPADNGGGNGGGGSGGNGGRRNGGGGQGGGGNWRQQMADRMKQMLGATDDEMQVLQPKIDQVMQLQRDAGGRGGFGGRRGGGGQGGPGGGGPGGGQGAGGPNNGQPQSDVQQKIADLRTTLDNKDAPASEISAKLEAVRAAKAKAKDDLAKAQKDLKDVLTARQEAVLVMMGLLD